MIMAHTKSKVLLTALITRLLSITSYLRFVHWLCHNTAHGLELRRILKWAQCLMTSNTRCSTVNMLCRIYRLTSREEVQYLLVRCVSKEKKRKWNQSQCPLSRSSQQQSQNFELGVSGSWFLTAARWDRSLPPTAELTSFSIYVPYEK